MNGSLPPLFKYVSPEGVDILEKERIKFSPPSEFNDPFDLHPSIVAITGREKLRRASKVTKQELKIPENMPRKERREMLRSASKQLAAYMRDNSEKLAAQIQAGVVNQLSRRAGVLCLAGAKDNLKMWAHYAKSHRGFLLEFNTESPSFRDLGHVYPVNYSPRRPVCDPLDLVGISWCITKGMEWEEEHEFRIIREFRHCVEVEQNGHPIRVCPLPKDAIKAFYLGVNMAASDRDRVIGSVRGTNIQFLQTKLPREVFGLEFQSLG